VRSGAIICYHGIASESIRSPIHHTIAELEAAVGVARDLGRIVPLSEFIGIHQSGRSTAGLFAITFDDAYLSLKAAAAFLRREQVPLTVFAVSDALDDGRVFWWDRLGSLLERLTRAQAAALSDRWGVPAWFRDQWAGPDFLPGWELRQWVVARYAGQWPDELEETAREMVQPADLTTTDRSMTWAELSEFASTGLVEIGVHTRSHPVLPLLPIAEQREQIAGCYEALRGRFPSTSPVLAAPYGLFNEETIAVTRASGLQACLGLGERTLRYGGSSGALPRFCMMHPQSRARLGARFSGVFDRIRAWRGEGDAEIPALPAWSKG
jgi:peptidoglycan/xylan/chitin deacetylase (PgdA/CDA1 family)